MPRPQQVVLALATIGKCSLDDIAAISGRPRLHVALDMKTALHAIKQ